MDHKKAEALWPSAGFDMKGEEGRRRRLVGGGGGGEQGSGQGNMVKTHGILE